MNQEGILTPALLDKLRSTAGERDARNEFAAAELAELTDAGYLTQMLLPGANMVSLLRNQFTLAQAAPELALGVNMHLLWTAVAAQLKASGDSSLQRVLDDAAAGEVFAFGISEAGNDTVLFDSITSATPEGNGYTFTGTKIFTSLSPAWTRLGVHGKNPDGDLVFAMLHRDHAGDQLHGDQAGESITAANDWDVLGMRASYSCTTTLAGARATADQILAVHPTGPTAMPLVFWIFACFELSICAVYAGLAQRAATLAAEAVGRRCAGLSGAVPAQNPAIRASVAELASDAEAARLQVFGLAGELLADDDPALSWFPRLSGLKLRVSRLVSLVVSGAMAAAGGGAFQNDSELSRLYRDAAAIHYHPTNQASALEGLASTLLGPLE